MRKIVKFGIAAVSALFLYGGAAHAAQIVQTQNSFAGIFSLDGFDGGLGTLYDVKLEWDLSASFSGNDPANLCSALSDCEGHIRLNLGVVGGALGPIVNNETQFISNPEVDAGFNETLINSGSASFISGLSAFLSPNPIGDILVASFATGDLLNGWTNLVVGPPTGTLTLTYNYGGLSTLAIAEPGTVALFALGLAGLGYARRRKAA